MGWKSAGDGAAAVPFSSLHVSNSTASIGHRLLWQLSVEAWFWLSLGLWPLAGWSQNVLRQAQWLVQMRRALCR